MPEAPRTPRRSLAARQTTSDGLNTSTPKARPQSTCEASSVQDRIRQWQAQGAADALALDAVSVRSVPASVASSNLSRPGTPGDNVTYSAPARKNRWTMHVAEESPSKGRESRSSSAPRKRLVSDEHWKSSRRQGARKSSTSTRRKHVVTPHHDLTYTSTPRQEDREAWRQRRRNERLSKEGANDTRLAEPKDLNAYIDQELSRRLASSPEADNTTREGELLDNTDAISTRSYSLYDDVAHTIAPSKYADTQGQPEPLHLESRKFKSGGILGKTREMFNKPEVLPVSNRVPSIQAWLEEQPDPFTERAPDVMGILPAAEVPKPLKKRSRRTKRRCEEYPSVDPNQIWESVTTHRVRDDDIPPLANGHASPPRSSALPHTSPASVIPPENAAEETSPRSIRRRGAARDRRSRQSESTRHASTPAADTTTPPLPIHNSGRHSPTQIYPPMEQLPFETVAPKETCKALPPPPTDENDEELTVGQCGLKRSLTTHEDLMSVLSLPMHRKSTRARRHARQVQQSASHVLEALAAEEEGYSKELRTLVDGVVPVLLQAVLSKSSSIAAAGLFNVNPDPSDFSYTKPIIDMGISLERLKSLHARIPLKSVDSLLAWAQNARRAYEDYIKAWRLGFQDVVVNLAPLDDKANAIDTGMARDADGNVVDSQGQKVDVAYLLKRPLVRVKNLAKTFESIKGSYDRPLAIEVAQAFTDVTAAARQRHREEQARLEDEAAAALDNSRARAVRSLGPCNAFTLNKSRKVRARDTFDMALWHTSGQRLDCQVEMIFRDDPEALRGGDVLICEVDETGKWLLFPPIELTSISARRGEDDIDLVVMIRGPSSLGKEWHELLALKSDEPEAIGEWMTMLGSTPLPPRLNRSRSFLERRSALAKQDTSRPTTADSNIDVASTSTSIPSEPDIPLGEPSVISSCTSLPSSKGQKTLLERFVPRLHLGGGLQSKPTRPVTAPPRSLPRKPVPSNQSSASSTTTDRPASSHKKPSAHVGAQDGVGRSRDCAPGSPPLRESYMMSGALVAPAEVQAQNTEGHQHEKSVSERGTSSNSHPPAVQRPAFTRQLSATPSEGLPSITKLRNNTSQEASQSSVPLTDSIRDQWTSLSGSRKTEQQREVGDVALRSTARASLASTSVDSQHYSANQEDAEQAPPAPPAHREGSISQQRRTPAKKLDNVPQMTPKSTKRRSSSPLKHEYAPSTASDTDSESESEDGSDASSETSDDFMSEIKDISTPLVAVGVGNKRNSQSARPPPARPQPPAVPSSSGTRTLAPSDSASQGPYRRVPSSVAVPDDKKLRTIAMICSWSDRGMWEQVHPDECSIIVSPGVIEAFPMSAAHSGDTGKGLEGQRDNSSDVSEQLQPLVAFELTPIVPLRRGTALDINIRSPPTPNSQLKTTNNILFRSRNADECDNLYSMINWARCNNPTYIQLEKARPRQPPVSFNIGPAPQGRTRSGGSWFSFGNSGDKSSYRASSAPMSISRETEASTSTMTTAFSALKRLGVSSAFNLNRSSISRKSGWATNTSGSLYSSNSGTGSGSGSSTPIPSQVGLVPGRDGPNVPTTSAEAVNGGGMVNNMKVRIYIRKGQNWANLGSGRLSVLPAPEGPSVPVADGEEGLAMGSPNLLPIRGQPGSKGPRLASSGHTPHRLHGDGREKRIVVRKSKKDEVVLLDAVLGESCFERVMQTGIAIKVWTENAQVQVTGGVMTGKEQIYMLQFPGTREAGWVFGLVGSYRYTNSG